jgi:hypothetical protein
MKTWFIFFLLMLAILIAALYIFIPNKLEISKTAYLSIAPDVANRNVSEESRWINWWPNKSSNENTRPGNKPGYLVCNEISYKIIPTSINAIEVLILPKDDTLNSTILIIPLKQDSTALHWKGVIETGYNPFKKIQYYQQAKLIQKCMDDIFKNLQSFFEKKENLYSIPIERRIVTDTILVTLKANTIHYPTTKEVYDLISRLKQYISMEGAEETNHPMLHVLKPDSNRFVTMVAIPINKVIKNSGGFAFKRMVPGNILVTEIRGGNHSVKKAFTELETYIKDYDLSSPAIPFESLVTNRMNEPDTAKWITRIYYPIL